MFFNHAGHINQHICLGENNCLLFILVKAFVESRKGDLWQQLFIPCLVYTYSIQPIQTMQNGFEQEFANTTRRVTDTHARLNVCHIDNSTNDLQRSKILPPIFLADGFFQECFKKLALEIIVYIFKRAKIIETLQNLVEYSCVSGYSLIIFGHKDSAIDNGGFIFGIAGE